MATAEAPTDLADSRADATARRRHPTARRWRPNWTRLAASVARLDVPQPVELPDAAASPVAVPGQ